MLAALVLLTPGQGLAQSRELIRLNGRVVAIETASSCSTAQSALIFRSTGFNGSLLAEGSVDPNWKMVSNASNYGGSSGTDAIVTSSLTGGATANAKYVNPAVGGGHVPEGTYVFRQMLDLSCHNPATAVIAGNVIADNHVQIFVNGVARSAILGPYDVVNSFSISGSGGGVFIAGWNVVDFVVTNTAGAVGNLSGVRVEVTSATATVNASASGAKFAVTRTPAGGNFTQGSTVSVSSGSENVTWSLEGSPGGTLTPNGNSATYTAPTSFTGMLVATIKATNGSGVVAYQPLWFNPGSGAGACSSASSTLTFRSTGFNGSLLAEGSVDPNWKMVSNASNYGGSSGTDAIVTSSLTGGATANAKYVNPAVGGGHVPEGTYVFRQMLDLSCHNPATAVIAGNVIADNYVQIFVNGVARSAILGPYDVVNSFSISGSGGGVFIAGWNVVDFVVTNTAGAVGNLSGVRVEVTSATATVNASASGAKFAVTRTPAGGNFTQGSTVSVSSGSENVTWSLEGSPGGTLTPNGNSATYTAPTSFTGMLVATIKATNGSGVVAYQPLWFNPGSGSGSVAITPAAPGSLAPYQTLSFSATVTGGTTNNVKWRVLSKTAVASSDGIFNTGTSCAASSIYRAPSTVTTAGNVIIEAESCDNAAWKTTAVIPVTVGSSVTISAVTPDVTTVSGTQQFAATVSNADNTAVQWSVSPAGAHSISTSGLYTASTFTGSATVTARSAENTNVAAAPETFNVSGGGTYEASLVTFSTPPSLVQGQAFTSNVTMANPVGGLTWDTTASAGSNQVTLGSQSPANNTFWGVSSGTTGTASVSAGSSAVFSFSGRAPVTVTGQQVMDWQLKRGSGTWFGPIVRPSFSTVGVVAGTKQSVVVSQPGALSAQGSQNFTVNVRFRNTGTAVWWGSAVNGSNAFQLRSRWRLAGSSGAWSSAVVPLPQNYLDPNGEVPFSFPQLAPSVPGSYDLRWQMEQNGGAAFGSEASSTLTVQSALPGVFGMTPINGSAAEASFTAVYSGGSSPLNIARFLVWNTPGYGNPNCVVEYTASTNQVRIGDWLGTMSSPITLGTNGMISNARCYLRAQDSSISSAQNGSNAVQLTLRVGFSSPMIGTWDVFAMAENTAAQSTGWVLQGQWSIPNVISVVVTPGSATLASGESRSFTAVVSGTSNTGVGWSQTGWGSVSPPTGGTTTFTAGTVTSTQTSSVIATSLADTTKTGISYLTIHSSPSVVSIVDFRPASGSGIEGDFSIEANGGNAPVNSIQFYANTSMMQSGGCIVTVYPQSGTVSLALPGGTFVSGSFNSGWLYGQYCNVNTNFSWAPINPNNNSAIANIRVSFLPWTSHTGWLSLFAKTSNTAGASSLQWEYRGSWSKQ